MVTIRNIVFLLILLADQSIGWSQNTIRTTSTNGSVRDRFYTEPYENIEGTPYMDTAYVKGIVYTYKGILPARSLRYNIFKEQMEYLNNGVLYAIVPELLISKIELGSKTFVVDVYPLKDKPTFGFFVPMDSGRINLLLKMSVGMTEFVPARALQEPKPPKYVRQPDTYYYSFAHGPLLKVSSVRKFIENLPDHKREMEEFAKKEKISFKNPDDMTRFIHFYNSLQ